MNRTVTATPIWLWDLCPGAAMLHILATNGRTLKFPRQFYILRVQ